MKAIQILAEAATLIVACTPKNRIKTKAEAKAPRTAPKVLMEYNVPTSFPIKFSSRETSLLRTGRVAPIKVAGIISRTPQTRNLTKLV